MKGFGKIDKYIAKYGLKYLCSILLVTTMMVFIPAITIHAENDFTVTDTEGTAVITAEALNVRSGPGTEYDVIGKAKAGEEFAVSGQTDNGWYRIAYNDKDGYVSGEYAEVTMSGKGGQNGAVDIPDEEMAPIPGIGGVWQKIKAGGFLSVIALIFIPIVLVAIGFTVKSMRRENEGDDFEDEDYMEDYYPEDEDYSEDEIDPEDENYLDGEDADFLKEEVFSETEAVKADLEQNKSSQKESAAKREETTTQEPDDIDLREERAREAYLSREVAPFIEEEEAPGEAERELAAKKEKQEKMHDDESDAELKQAMEKLAELQEEIERIKQKK